MAYNLEILSVQKGYLHKDSLQPHQKGPNRILLTNPWVAKLKGIDTWIYVFYLFYF